MSCHRQRGPYTATSRLLRSRKQDLIDDLASGQIRQPLSTFEEGWKQWQQTIGMMRDRYRGPAKPRKKGKRKRILVIPDLHIPHHEPAMVASMMERERGNVDLAICIGDLGDAYSHSRYAKYKSVPYSYEWSQITLMMQQFSETFPLTKIIIGNHDARLRRAIASHLTVDMVEAISTMAGGTLCPITALSRQYKNIEIAKHPVPNTDLTIDWLLVEGDALLAHPEKYSRVPGSALRFFQEWAADNSDAIGLDGIRLVVMGHTHTLALFPWRSNSLLLECGCLCQTQSYMTGAKVGGRPQRRAYCWFEQIDGVTDLNSVKWRWLDVEDGPWRKK
jgi:predicted phosphodiesterase